MKGKIGWIVVSRDSSVSTFYSEYPDRYLYNGDYTITKVVYFEVEDD